jgi:redox-sensitive bicupin YhaK (pirin superfamily)
VIETVLVPRVRDLGDGFQVRRALPDAKRRSVGPFVFFDQMGPVALAPGRALDVRPHPHIGLATVTYLFEGEIMHRDSLGTVQAIRPGEVNWMTAGRGIVHSERTPQALREGGSRVFGIQTWVALPRAHEETDPQFLHFAADALPVVQGERCRTRLVVGALLGQRSPVPALSEMFYADTALDAGGTLALGPEYEERAAYVAQGTVVAGDREFPAGSFLVFGSGSEIQIKAKEEARLLLLGGAPLDGPRYVWWNFVSSRKERIEQAASDWKAGAFPRVAGDEEFIPLPERGPSVADYP